MLRISGGDEGKGAVRHSERRARGSRFARCRATLHVTGVAAVMIFGRDHSFTQQQFLSNTAVLCDGAVVILVGSTGAGSPWLLTTGLTDKTADWIIKITKFLLFITPVYPKICHDFRDLSSTD